MQAARRALLWASATVGYVAIALASLELATVSLSSSPVWPPAGFAIGLLVVFGMGLWPAILAGAFVANWLTTGNISISLLIGAGNSGEALLAAFLIRRWSSGHPLDRVSGVAAFVAAAGAGALLSSIVGIGALRLDGLPAELTADVWQTWFLGNFAGALVVAPVMLSVRQLRPGALVALTVGALAGLLAFATTGWTLAILLPAVAAFTISVSRPTMSVGMLGIAAGAVAMTMQGEGAFWGRTSNDALLLLQLFLIGSSTTSLMLAAGIRRRVQNPTAVSWGSAMLAVGPIVAAAAFIGLALHPTISSLDNARQGDAAQGVLEAWEEAILDQDNKMQAIRGLYEAKPDLSREEFDAFVQLQGWTFGTGGSTAIGFARIVHPDQLEAYTAAIRADPQLLPIVRDNFSVFPPSNETTVPVEHVYPMAPAPGAIGFSLRSSPERQATLDRAAATGLPIASEPLPINTPSGEFPGFFISMPVEENGEVYGFVVLAQTVRDSAPSIAGAEYRMVDVTNGSLPLHETDAFETASSSFTMNAWGRTWELSVRVEDTISGTDAQAPWFILAGGSLLSVAMAATVYAHDATRARANDLSHTMVSQAKVDAARIGEIRRLEDRDQFRRHFLNMVAHELRTPLTPIRAQAWLLTQNSRPEDAKSLAILNRGVARMSAVVDDLLIAAKLESDGMALTLGEVQLHEIAEEAVEAMQDFAATTGTKVNIQSDYVKLQADGERLGQVIDNLLTNAVKFAPGGLVTMRVFRRGDEAILEVSDDGIGIAPERIEELGQPFVQVHDTQAVGVKGTGLGIYICQAIAKLHGGRIEIASDGLGTGTSVTLRLPIK